METTYQLLKALVDATSGKDFKVTWKSDWEEPTFDVRKEKPVTSDNIKEQIAEYKELLTSLDDETFTYFIEKIDEAIDTTEFEKLLDKEDLSLSEGVLAIWFINYAKGIIRDYVDEQIDRLQEIRERL